MIKEVIMPKLGQTMEEGTINKWVKKEGEQVKKGEVLLEITTDKATLEVESYAEGILKKIVREEGDVVPVTEVIGYIGDEGDEVPEAPAQAAAPSAEAAPAGSQAEKAAVSQPVEAPAEGDRVMASPRAKRLAKEKGIDISRVNGTGPGGRIVEEDVLKAVESGQAAPAPAAKPAKAEAPRPVAAPVAVVPGAVPLSPMRKTIAARMTQSKTTAPHFYLKLSVHMSKCMESRERMREKKVDVSLNDFIVKAVGRALKDFPKIAGYYTPSGIVERNEANVGVAVSVDDGILVPVVRNADAKSIEEIAKETAALVGKARSNKITPDDMSGGVITVSNLGMFGVEEFVAIINPGESSILAVGAIKDEVMLSGWTPANRKVMSITLSCDHRILDGVLGAQFLCKVKEYLENPY